MWPGPAWAVPSSLVSRAAVVHRHVGCNATVTAFSFAAYSPLTHMGRFAQGYVSFNCASSVAEVELSAGDSGQFRNRRMTATGVLATLLYNVYLDPSHTQVFGDGTGGSSAYMPGPNVARGGFPIYGEIADGQTQARIATYSDTIHITINLAP
jgi:spore coat protein U-like protein